MRSTHHLRLRRRDPHTNTMDDVADFTQRWDDPSAGRPEEFYQLKHSSYGNINISGEPADYTADDLSPHDAQWWAAIEPGVVPLVRLVVEEFGWITYSSCEGHLYVGLDHPPKSRDLGILPRDEEEAERVAKVLADALDRVEASALTTPHVYLRAWHNELACKASGRIHTVYDLAIEPAEGASWPDYFACVDAASVEIVALLRAAAG
ncbi:hypothetical protein ACIBI9_61955 [Nonomuraea sp. NPDC050451]|uniref:hypothetical protein n=1 Tax=Nonomuraea sp. NPDC050451 TaxID=3364364 RepID=UPI00379E977E